MPVGSICRCYVKVPESLSYAFLIRNISDSDLGQKLSFARPRVGEDFIQHGIGIWQ
jgi:hypothetical protein